MDIPAHVGWRQVWAIEKIKNLAMYRSLKALLLLPPDKMMTYSEIGNLPYIMEACCEEDPSKVAARIRRFSFKPAKLYDISYVFDTNVLIEHGLNRVIKLVGSDPVPPLPPQAFLLKSEEKTIEKDPLMRQRRLIIASVFLLLITFFLIHTAALKFDPVQMRISDLTKSKDIGGLLSLNNETTRYTAYIDDALAQNLQQDIDRDLGSGFDFPDMKLTTRPYEVDIAQAIASIDPFVIEINESDLIAVLPHLETPTWVFEVENTYSPVTIGVRVKAFGLIGVIIQVEADVMVFQLDNGSTHIFYRPRYSVCNLFPETPGEKSVIYSRKGGNLRELAKFLNLPYDNPMEGNISGFFPPWKSMEMLKDIIVDTQIKDVPVFYGFYNRPIQFRSSVDRVLSVLSKEFPVKVTWDFGDFGSQKIVYSGQELQPLFEFLELTLQITDEELTLWKQ